MSTVAASLSRSCRRRPPLSAQRGFTLVELMVALVIGLFIAVAAAAALVVARQGFTAVDSAGQLRENARFTADLLQRIVVQAGYEDVAGGSYDRDPATGSPPDDAKYPGLLGYDNAYYTGGNPAGLASNSRSAGTCGSSDTSCNNYDDILIVRFQGASDSTGAADTSMINCAGIAEPYSPVAGARAYAIFHIIRQVGDLEPALACSYLDPTSGAWNVLSLVKGVEGFQVLYGTDGVTPTLAPPAGNGGMNGTVDRYLTADQLTVSGNAAATSNNWRRVRSVRIGLVFRGDIGSASTAVPKDWDMRGASFTPTADTNGDVLHTPADGRLRQSMIFTIHLRNQQGYDVCTSTATPCK